MTGVTIIIIIIIVVVVAVLIIIIIIIIIINMSNRQQNKIFNDIQNEIMKFKIDINLLQDKLKNLKNKLYYK